MTRATRWHAAANRDELACRAARFVAASAADALKARGTFSVVLAGGETPRGVYRLLRRFDTDWRRWRVYFGDERCLPPDDAARNSRMASEEWLDHVALTPGQIHAIPAERGADAAAAAYVQTLHAVGEFDCVLLGLGRDGHTASLFPGRDPGVGESAPDALAVYAAPKPPPERVSLSAARLGRARRVLFLVAGEEKRGAVRAWRAGDPIPASAVTPAGGVDVLLEASLLGTIATST